ncbi:Clp protease N-terminal domain-containing protein [Actinoplanes sp. NPDC051513]|uniref:Clp protease N-terminal domain-containing protein n=1 Tax=Actinoplanes sp. NPDC051513 TaxID=3363908 RepID=UPI0037A3EA95
MSTFDEYFVRILDAAAAEATADGSAAVEAQHLLLAIAGEGSPALEAAGLDRPALRRALEQEFTRSLATAGVRVPGGLPRSTPDPARTHSIGASAKVAIERSFDLVERKRDIRPGHLLLGVIQAELGTVPRALALAGVDRAALRERALREVRE